MTAVLFTCAGQRVDVVTAFARAGGRTVAVDANPLAPAIYHADVHSIVPRIDDAGYLPALQELIREHDVKLIVPLTDLDQILLAEHRDELGAIVLLPDAEVVRRTADKYLTHVFFEEHGIPSPASWLPGELPAEIEFPVLVKARFGGAFPLPRAAGSRYPELALALARGERLEPRLGDFREGIVMTRFFSHLSLTASGDGTLEPFAEELPEPVAGEPTDR